MNRFLKGFLFCTLALLVGTGTSAFMMKFFPDFTAELASVVAIEGDTDDSVESFGNYVEIIALDDEFFPCTLDRGCLHTSQPIGVLEFTCPDFDLPADTVP